MSDEHTWLICSVVDGLHSYYDARDALAELDVDLTLDGTDIDVWVRPGDLVTREAAYSALGVPDLTGRVAEA